jgi:hypothetical protein
MMLRSIAVALALGSAAVAQSPEMLNNDSVLRMIAAGIPEQAIVAKIKASPNRFELGTDQLIALKDKGVSGPILAAMLEPVAKAPEELSDTSPDPMVPHYPGVYMFGPESGTMVRLMPTASNQVKTGGLLGYAFTGGIASLSFKALIPGDRARVRAGAARPTFYMFFDESVPRDLIRGDASVWNSGAGSSTVAPDEMSLVRFMDKKGAREARVGSANIAGGKSGVMDKDRITFTSEQVRPGVFKVTVTTDLPPGEYGFIKSLSGGNVAGGGGALTARVFDFGIGG